MTQATRGRKKKKRVKLDSNAKRKCNTCDKKLGLDNFYKDSRTPDGYRYECKSCFEVNRIRALINKLGGLEGERNKRKSSSN